MRAVNLLRSNFPKECSRKGLRRCGFEVLDRLTDPGPGDVVITWNRQSGGHEQATFFESRGATVLVMENGWLGDALKGAWVALSIGHHAGAGSWPEKGATRWDSLSVGLLPWRHSGERVILGQRCIGEPGIASPPGWAEGIQRKYGGRIRHHPGVRRDGLSLDQDLRLAGEVLTWNSGAALKALMWGIPVRCAFPRWIGMMAASPMEGPLNRSDELRLQMFRRMAWSMWTLDEIADGTAFHHLLG